MAPKVRHLTKRQQRFRKALGRAIADLRQDRGMSQEQLASKIGIGQGAQSNREAGVTTFPIDALTLYAVAFGWAPSEIIQRAGYYMHK